MLLTPSDSTVEISAGAFSTLRPLLAVECGLGRGGDLVQPGGQLRARPANACSLLIGVTRPQYREIAKQRANDLQPDRQRID